MIFKAGICTREELWEKKTVFSRMMMQKIGTEIIREQVNPNFWIDKMHQKIQGILLDYGRLTTIIIHDVRFINEATVVRTYSDNLLVRIVRPSLVLNKEENTHRSETEQDQIEVNLTIVNDGTLEELKEKALYLILNTELNNPSIGRMEIK
jgi:hypothetical protein